ITPDAAPNAALTRPISHISFICPFLQMQAFFQYTTKRAAKKENPCILSPMGVEYSRQTNTGELVEAG
ncbi:hypothetical protein LJD42_30125, partial [Escherichia coli]|nr:hypothetical protein [Escherichia coli]